MLQVPHVVGCGKVFNVIEIAIDENVKNDDRYEETVQKIKQVMNASKWVDYGFCTKSGYIKPLHSSGDQICLGGANGTLGAFANAEPTKKSNNAKMQTIYSRPFLIALISRHIAIQDQKLFCNNQHIADVMQPTLFRGADIAAARVFDRFRKSCTQVFRKQNGMKAPCRLLSVNEDLDKYEGHRVHIWGATSISKPGLGMILSCKYGINSETENGRLIMIHDTPSSKCFASNGDSGSVVCIASKTGKELFAIGMLMGSLNETCDDSQEKQYAAVEIKFAIGELEKHHQITIDWIDTE